MKKVFLAITIIGFSFGVNAQNLPTPNSKSIRKSKSMRSDSSMKTNDRINAQVMTDNGMNPNAMVNNSMMKPDSMPKNSRYAEGKMNRSTMNKTKRRKFAMDSYSMTNSNMNSNMGLQIAKGTESDGLMMKNGKMMETKNGNITEMNYNITLANGTKVMNDGSIINKSGNKMKLKEGGFIDFYGKMKE